MFHTQSVRGKVSQSTIVTHRNVVSFASHSLLWHCGSLGLPQMVMNCQSIDTDGHGFGWNQIKLLSVWAVFVKFVNHFLGDALWPCPCQLVDFFRVRKIAIKCSELAASIAEQNDVVVGIALLKLLEVKETKIWGGRLWKVWHERCLSTNRMTYKDYMLPYDLREPSYPSSKLAIPEFFMQSYQPCKGNVL